MDEGGSAAASAAEAAEQRSMDEGGSAAASAAEATEAAPATSGLPLPAAARELRELTQQKLPKGARVVPRPAAGKGKEVSPCWQYFCCLAYDDERKAEVMCIVRIGECASCA
jgi:hypothetical protein